MHLKRNRGLVRITFALLLSTVMVLGACLGLVPATALADDTHTHDGVTFNTPWGTGTDESTSLPQDAGNYYLTANVTLSETWTVPLQTINLCLNGHTITLESSDPDESAVIKLTDEQDGVTGTASLGLYDCQNGTTGVTRSSSSKGGQGIVVGDGAYLNMSGVSVTGNKATSNGAGIYVKDGGVVSMTDCVISGNTTTEKGAGVYLANGAKLMMSGNSTIQSNSSDTNGGGIFVNRGASFYVEGTPVVAGNTLTSDSSNNNVYLANGAVIVMQGALTEGSAALSVSMKTAGTFTSGYSAAMGTSIDPANIFTNDDEDYAVQWNKPGTGTGTEAMLSKYHDISFNTIDHGVVSATPGSGIEGTEVTLTVTPDDGYELDSLTVKSGSSTILSVGEVTSQGLTTQATSTSYTFGMPDDDVTISATFSATDYDVTVSTDGNGTATASATTANVGDEITLTATPATGYEFDAWEVVSGGVTITDDKFTMPANDVVIHATFKEEPCTITFDANADDAEGTMDDQEVEKGAIAPLKANAFTRSGYEFSAWNTKADGSGTSYEDGASVEVSSDMTLYAQWTSADTYTVKFDSNEPEYATEKGLKVSGTMDDQTINSGTATALTTNAFSIKHYTFSKWNTEAAGTGTSYADGEEVTDIADADETVTLYAQWTADTYTMTFDANGGTGTMEGQDFKYGEAQTLTANEFTRSGYEFSGWNTSADGSGTTVSDGANVTISTDLTLYAQWTSSSTYTVVFDSNEPEYAANKGLEVSGTMANQTIKTGKATALTTNAFSIKHYTFAKWNTEADGSGTSYTDGEKVTDIADADETVTLYAQWTADTYTVTFDANGGTGTMEGQDFKYGEAQTLTANEFTRSGYEFSGWNTSADGSGTSIADGANVNISMDLTLYAQWTSTTTCTITFDANGGTGTMNPQTVTKGATATLNANTFTRAGYTFKAWNTKQDGTGTPLSNGASVKVSSDVTLYAQWTKGGSSDDTTTCTITFNANGGSGTMEPQTVKKGVSTTLYPNRFTRTGYVFRAWNTKPDGSGTSLSNGAAVKVSSSVTLYAQWTRSSSGTTPGSNTTGGTTRNTSPLSRTADPTSMVGVVTMAVAGAGAIFAGLRKRR